MERRFLVHSFSIQEFGLIKRVLKYVLKFCWSLYEALRLYDLISMGTVLDDGVIGDDDYARQGESYTVPIESKIFHGFWGL